MQRPTPHPHALRYSDWSHASCVFRRVLVIVDVLAAKQPAVDKAARLAARCGGSLELFACDSEQGLLEGWAGASRLEEYRSIRCSRQLEELERLAAPLRASGLSVTTVSRWHASFEQGIDLHVLRTLPDLVVKDTRSHAVMPSTFSRTDWKLIQQLPVPLLLVRDGEWPERPLVAAGIDPLHSAERPVTLDETLVEISLSMGVALGAEIEVLHVLENPPHVPGEGVSEQRLADTHETARNSVQRMLARARLPVTFLRGGVAEQLRQYVQRRRPSVLLLGVAAGSRITALGPTGVSAQILEQVNCDLLVVKPAGFVSPLLVTED